MSVTANLDTDSGVGPSVAEDGDVSSPVTEETGSNAPSSNPSDVIVFGTDLDLPGICGNNLY